MKKIKLLISLLIILVLATIASACTPNNNPPSPSEANSNSSQIIDTSGQSEILTNWEPFYELDFEQPEGIYYIYNFNNPESPDEYDIINIRIDEPIDFSKIFPYALQDEAIPSFDITINGDTAELNFDTSLPSNFTHYKSIYATLLFNTNQPTSPIPQNVTKLKLLESSIPHISEYTDNEGFVLPMDIHLKSLSEYNYSVANSHVEYSLANSPIMRSGDDLPFDVTFSNSNYIQLISRSAILNYPTDFSSPEEIDNSLLISASFNNTLSHILVNQFPTDIGAEVSPYNLPIVNGSDINGAFRNELVLKEHMDQTVTYLFGDTVSIDHSNESSKNRLIGYNNIMGCYVDLGQEFYAVTTPIVLERTETIDSVELIVTSANYGIDGQGGTNWTVLDSEGNITIVEDESKLLEIATEKAVRYKIVLKSRADGQHTVYSKEKIAR